jgi:peptidoglycan hydrolase-like protein with peptidoglycan-binding domain
MAAPTVMYDSEWNNSFPSDPPAVGGYVDGSGGDQPNYDWLVEHFPSAQHFSFTLSSSVNADCLDIENGAASAYEAASWYAVQQALGSSRPALYMSAAPMESTLIPIITALGSRSEVRLLSAHYDAGAHICGPSTCGMTSIDMDGTQWTDNALGRDLDQSQLLPSFFSPTAPISDYLTISEGSTGVGVSICQARLNVWGASPELTVDGDFGPHTQAAVEAFQRARGLTADGVVGARTWAALLANPPAPSDYGAPENLKADGGLHSVKLTWQAPSTVRTAEYVVFIYKGTTCDVKTSVSSYPRNVGNVLEYQGGSLDEKTQYTAHVVAQGPAGRHLAPFTYASATFTTG